MKKGLVMGKTYSKKHKKSEEECHKKHTTNYKKQHEKGKYPRKVWPTDSERDGHKGPKI